jgi:tetratricopeptide (TPR) repeat protein
MQKPSSSILLAVAVALASASTNMAVAQTAAEPVPAPSINTSDASQLLSQGLSLIRSNRNDEAATVLKRAVQLAPDSAKAHHSLGLALAKLGDNAGAIASFKKAIELNPNLDSAWLTLGGLYQSLGRLDDAIATYNEFLTRFAKNKDIASTRDKVTELLNGLTVERDRLARLREENKALQHAYPIKEALLNVPAQSDSDDYLAEATRPGIVRWSKMPIKVYVHDARSVPGYKPAWGAILQQSFRDWEKASGGQVKFELVDSMPQPFDGIECYFMGASGKDAGLENEAEAGEAKMYVMPGSGDLHSGTIKILTKSFSAVLPLTDNRVRYICLHEIGHALGLSGHTDNPDDIMFLSTSFKDEWRELSPRDARTIQRFYSSK